MNKHIKAFLLGLGFVGVSFSCDSDFEEINTNPNAPVTAPGELLLANITRNAANTLYNMQIGGEIGATWAQQWAMVQYNDPERYAPRQTSIEALWDQYYASVISDARSMAILAEEDGNDALHGVALVMQAYAFGVLTDTYGSIPFTEAIAAGEGNFIPVYDDQQTVYAGILSMLDQAESLLATGNGEVSEDFDLVYHGDAAGWRKFANSLKFRSLMRISARQDVGAALTALLGKPMFTSNDDDADLEYLATQPNANPIYENIVYGVREEWKVSDVTVGILNSLTDPRLPIYVAENDGGEYRGKPVGLRNVPSDEYNYNNVSGLGEMYLDPELPALFMSYPELMFLKAEAAQKGLITGDAAAFYAEGIRASMAYNGVATATAEAYITSRPLANGATGLNQIYTQKWIALYGQGMEVWIEWKRTGVPALSSPADSYLPNALAYRLSYPGTEQTTNRANYQAAVAAQGADVLTTKLWWMN